MKFLMRYTLIPALALTLGLAASGCEEELVEVPPPAVEADDSPAADPSVETTTSVEPAGDEQAADAPTSDEPTAISVAEEGDDTAAADVNGEETGPGDDAGAQSDEAVAEVEVPAGMTKLELELPRPMFKETPKDAPADLRVEKPRTGPREPIIVPEGTKLVSKGAKVIGPTDQIFLGKLELITDGDKEANEGSWVEIAPGLQQVQIDLGQPYALYAIVIWHYHGQARVYHDVVVQIADDPDFIENVRIVFNNDYDNSAGLGVGKDLGYWESNQGKVLRLDGQKARYVRLYSDGNTSDPMNHYTEVEVYGKQPAGE